MSGIQFSEQELAFFEEGDTLTDEPMTVEDFSDLEDTNKRADSWVDRALALLLVTGSPSSES